MRVSVLLVLIANVLYTKLACAKGPLDTEPQAYVPERIKQSLLVQNVKPLNSSPSHQRKAGIYIPGAKAIPYSPKLHQAIRLLDVVRKNKQKIKNYLENAKHQQQKHGVNTKGIVGMSGDSPRYLREKMQTGLIKRGKPKPAPNPKPASKLKPASKPKPNSRYRPVSGPTPVPKHTSTSSNSAKFSPKELHIIDQMKEIQKKLMEKGKHSLKIKEAPSAKAPDGKRASKLNKSVYEKKIPVVPAVVPMRDTHYVNDYSSDSDYKKFEDDFYPKGDTQNGFKGDYYPKDIQSAKDYSYESQPDVAYYGKQAGSNDISLSSGADRDATGSPAESGFSHSDANDMDTLWRYK
ncbi:hypothetical protein AX774_g4364 [Zancudomyces culisetae]|uniref:Uncharacterized protein n=1 Tax=Zancudomyces culisetae TaxID=1213189 RepID=A0A1R1PMJ2_ZANCU|nr:hypothetical protein AX774_g8001 [Zancudomyces culisetae]OMH82085.1 hypothetical protein AX774_g4444 [Zancudomyces culisetae]OMH82167.1 hypothetical protein AX774_g4364 [Zancudomyces culisetae]|eukprot:OMH78613.1 hypothetical protein AX774_g8001 [Zancudomyces culisetae]